MCWPSGTSVRSPLDQGEIPRGTKAAPELGDLLGGERPNHALRLLKAKPGGNPALWAAVTERRSRPIRALDVVGPRGHRLSGMEAIHRAEHAEAMVDSLGSGLGGLVELIADILEQSGLIHFE